MGALDDLMPMTNIYNGGETAPASPLCPIIRNNFRVRFSDFGDLGICVPADRDFGRFVTMISLPSLTFSTRRRLAADTTESLYTADSARWDPVSLTLFDDTENKMLRQVMIQHQKQINDPTNSYFTIELLLFASTPLVPVRHYLHTGCTMTYAGHERDLDRDEPSRVSYSMVVQANDIQVLNGDSEPLAKSENVEDTGDLLYAPFRR
jgi:hypothetical protein